MPSTNINFSANNISDFVASKNLWTYFLLFSFEIALPGYAANVTFSSLYKQIILSNGQEATICVECVVIKTCLTFLPLMLSSTILKTDTAC